MQIITIKLTTLTPLWTGGINRDCDRLHETSVIGSLRWWYEALVRGLGGSACDPTDSKCDGDKHCAACELFGCTGWARKFRLLILDENDDVAQQIENGKNYTLKFIPLKSIHDEEAFLLFHTVQIISDIGSIGGKTVLKPSEVKSKNKNPHHADYGLIRLTSTYEGKAFQREQIIDFLKQFNKSGKIKNEDDYPALSNFWFIRDYYLSRIKMNKVLGRDNSGKYTNQVSDLQKWLGGEIGESKKIFSFHSNEAKRTWGYAKNGQLNDVISLLEKNKIKNIKTGEFLLKRMFNEGN